MTAGGRPVDRDDLHQGTSEASQTSEVMPAASARFWATADVFIRTNHANFVVGATVRCAGRTERCPP